MNHIAKVNCSGQDLEIGQFHPNGLSITAPELDTDSSTDANHIRDKQEI